MSQRLADSNVFRPDGEPARSQPNRCEAGDEPLVSRPSSDQLAPETESPWRRRRYDETSAVVNRAQARDAKMAAHAA